MKTQHGARLGLLALSLAGAAVTVSAGRAQQQDSDMMPRGGRTLRGTVSAVAPDHLTVKAETGETFQVDLTPNTRLLKGRDPIKVADVHPGDGLGAMGEIDTPNHTVHALFVSVVDAADLKRLRDNMGKTYITGKVTAMNELRLTILRTDGVTQTIQVDEDTSFRKGGRGGFNADALFAGGGSGPGAPDGPTSRMAPAADPGGESITLADIKVGDQIAGRGALKNGVFLPTQLAVLVPGARGEGGRRRRGGGTGDNSAGPSPGTMAEPK